jgi:LuxR family transcriptional regulator, maltose regulon positive regulatory protein
VVSGSAPATSAVAADQDGLEHVRSARLLPPRPSFPIVDRPRLIDSMSRGVSAAPLTLICAPAGSGKTILAAAWAQAQAETSPVSWLTLDDIDDQPGVFWSDVLDSLAQIGVVSASAMRPTNPDTVDPSFVERLAVDLLTRPVPVVLVLDEAERLKSRQVAEQLDLLLRNAGPRLRLILATRSDPLLSVHRYRLEGTVAEIRHDALAFTATETRALLECHGVEATEPTTMTLVDRTEGWAAGIRLAAMALRHRADPASVAHDIETRIGPNNPLITEYLVAEVLQGMPAGDREFLLCTSVVREISPGLANELTGRRDSERMLRDLSCRNTFVQQVPGSPGNYRTHSLFREFLGAQLALEAPVEVGEVHRRAARWFAASGRVADAVDHAVAAGDWVGAADLIVSELAIGTLLMATPIGTGIAKFLSRIPGDVDSAGISVVRAALALARGDLDHARRCITNCEELLSSAGTDSLLAAAVVRTQLCDGIGDTDATLVAAGYAREALRALPVEHAIQHQELWALVLGSEGTAHLRAGNFDAARASLAEALVAAAAGCEPQRLRCLAVLALTEVCRGNLSRGQELADTAERLAVESGVVAADRPAATHLAHAWVALERQDLPGAQHWLGRAARLPEAERDKMLASVSTLLRIRLRRDRGDIKGAQRLLSGHVVHVPWLQALFEAETMAIEGGADGRVGGEPRELAAETPSEKVEHLLLRAQRHCARGNLGAGRSAVISAIALAKDEGIRRPFTHIAPQVRLLIRTDPDIAVRATWLRPEHNSRARGPAQAEAPRIDQSLSDKELEVLRHLSALLTTEEIAATMFISVNTVKTHIRAILRKLLVTRRNEAVRRARELNIV